VNNSTRGEEMNKKTIVGGIVAIVGLVLLATCCNAAPLGEMVNNAQVKGDLRYDYDFTTTEGSSNDKGAFTLERVRFGAETTFENGGGELIFNYGPGGRITPLYAYGTFFPVVTKDFKFGGSLGRQPLYFATVQNLDRFEPNLKQSIAYEAGKVSNNLDGVSAEAIVGNPEGLNLHGMLQYRSIVDIGPSEETKEALNSYFKLDVTPWLYAQANYLEKFGVEEDLLAHVVALQTANFGLTFEHVSEGDELSYNFSNRDDVFSLAVLIGVGNSQRVELVGRVDWLESGAGEQWSMGTNWKFNNSVLLQGGVEMYPGNQDIFSGEENTEGVATIRSTVLFN
jgi:hypothetical protein